MCLLFSVLFFRLHLRYCPVVQRVIEAFNTNANKILPLFLISFAGRKIKCAKSIGIFGQKSKKKKKKKKKEKRKQYTLHSQKCGSVLKSHSSDANMFVANIVWLILRDRLYSSLYIYSHQCCVLMPWHLCSFVIVLPLFCTTNNMEKWPKPYCSLFSRSNDNIRIGWVSIKHFVWQRP